MQLVNWSWLSPESNQKLSQLPQVSWRAERSKLVWGQLCSSLRIWCPNSSIRFCKSGKSRHFPCRSYTPNRISYIFPSVHSFGPKENIHLHTESMNLLQNTQHILDHTLYMFRLSYNTLLCILHIRWLLQNRTPHKTHHHLRMNSMILDNILVLEDKPYKIFLNCIVKHFQCKFVFRSQAKYPPHKSNILKGLMHRKLRNFMNISQCSS